MENTIVREFEVSQEYFVPVLTGNKKHEIFRVNGFSIKEGDVILLKETDVFTKEITGRELVCQITYISKIDLGIDLYVVASLSILSGNNI